MASITGSSAKAGIKIASTWGTASECGAGNGLIAEITPNFNVSTLTARAIGSGLQMARTFTRGNFIPTISLVGDAGYHNNMAVILAQILGTSGAPSETTADQDDYLHTITFNSTLNAKYLTLAYQNSSATTLEFPTCAVRQFGLRTTTVPGYLEWSAELLAGTVNFTPASNNFADLNSVTVPDSELAAVDFDDTFWIDDHDGAAIDTNDQYNITGFDFSLTRPQEIIPEIKGSAGNSAPVASGLAEATFNINVKELADATYYTVWSAQTVKKGLFAVSGTTIGSGTAKSIKLYIPNLVLVTEPQNSLTDPGTNALALSFNVAAPASTVTGMGGSVYPYFEITNGLSTSLLA